MSIFSGPIKELHFISVDNFEMKHNKFSTCFFLSHCHLDHMKGIKDSAFLMHLKNNNYYLYCSNVSKLILHSFPELHSIYDHIKELGFGLNSICVPSRNLNGLSYNTIVSCIPAGHCPGSVMFLFESSQHSILYTGDFRFAVGDLSKFKQLHDGRHVKKIDKIYIDATFFHPNYSKFLPRDESILLIIKEINQWLTTSPKNMILLDMAANYGGEFIMQRVAEAFTCKIHVNSYIYELYSRVPEVREYLTDKCDLTRIHAKTRRHNHDCLINKEKDLILVIKPKAAPFQCSEKEKPISVIRKTRNQIEVNYSSHSSYLEIVDILSYLKPKDVEICTATYKSSINESKERMSEIILLYNEKTDEPAMKRYKISEPYVPINLVKPSQAMKYETDSDLDSPI